MSIWAAPLPHSCENGHALPLEHEPTWKKRQGGAGRDEVGLAAATVAIPRCSRRRFRAGCHSSACIIRTSEVGAEHRERERLSKTARSGQCFSFLTGACDSLRQEIVGVPGRLNYQMTALFEHLGTRQTSRSCDTGAPISNLAW